VTQLTDLFHQPIDPLQDYKAKHPHSLNILDMPEYLMRDLDIDRNLQDVQFDDILIKDGVYNNDLYEAIDEDMATWSLGYDKRRKIERGIAAYIRGKVAPLGIIHNALEIADRLDSCRLSGVVGVNPVEGNKIVQWKYKCGLNKLCPDEARSEQRRLSKRYMPVFEKWLDGNRRRTFQYAVFTIPNPKPGQLHDSLRDIYKRFTAMLKHKSFAAVKGCLATLEDPLSMVYDDDTGEPTGEYSWNVHINAMFLVDGHFDWETVQREWGFGIKFQDARSMKNMAANRGRDTDRRSVLLGAFQELLKYSVKHLTGEGGKKHSVNGYDRESLGMVDWPADRFVEWWMAHHGYRRSRSYGELYRVIDDRQTMDMSLIQWIGSVGFNTRSNRYSVRIDPRSSIFLIKENNSTFLNHQKRANYSNNSPGGYPHE